MSRSTLVRAGIVLAVWAALATFPQWSAFWESSRFAAGIIRQVLIFAIFASSLNLLVGYAGLPSLGHAAARTPPRSPRSASAPISWS